MQKNKKYRKCPPLNLYLDVPHDPGRVGQGEAEKEADVAANVGEEAGRGLAPPLPHGRQAGVEVEIDAGGGGGGGGAIFGLQVSAGRAAGRLIEGFAVLRFCSGGSKAHLRRLLLSTRTDYF